MDLQAFRATAEERQDANRMMLGLLSFMLFLGSLGCFYGASTKIRTESSGHLWWREESTVAVPTETRLVFLFSGILLMLVAFGLASILYRIAVGRAEPRDAARPLVTKEWPAAGLSREAWIQTVIGILGLVVALISAAAAWWA